MITLPVATAQRWTWRAVRLTSPDGTVAVVLTNLIDPTRVSADALMALYRRRWGVATPARAEKTALAIETFHRQTAHGLRQARCAIRLMAVSARLWRRLTPASEPPARAQPPFKHAIITLAHEADRLTPPCPEVAFMIVSERLKERARVRYDRPQTPRPSHPRVSKKPINKWQVDKAKRLAEA